MKKEFGFLILALMLALFAAVAMPVYARTAVPVSGALAISASRAGQRACVQLAEEKSVTLNSVQLAQLRTGQRVARIPELGALLGSFQEGRGERLVMRYPAGDKGALWAEELRTWLVALGVPAKYIVSDPDPRHDDNSVTMAIQQNGEQVP
ncbi:MAG: hypothetical protein ACYDHM_04615 [Acidiferrobacterales bacterium]